MANKYTHAKSPNAFKQSRINKRRIGSNLTVGGKKEMGAKFGNYGHPLGKTYQILTGIIGKVKLSGRSVG
jgi:hypothetical protein